MQFFNFLGFFFGKSFFCLFLGLMCFDKNKWMSWAVSILFFIATIFYMILGCKFKNEEVQKYHDIKNNNPNRGGTGPSREVQVQPNQNAFKI